MTAEFFLNSSGIKFENQLTSLNSFLGVDADYNYNYDYGTEVPVEGDENVKGLHKFKTYFSISSYEQKSSGIVNLKDESIWFPSGGIFRQNHKRVHLKMAQWLIPALQTHSL